MNHIMQSIRDEMRETRAQSNGCFEYYWGRFTALRLVCHLMADSNMLTGGCPDCHAEMRGDGSCCDACGWVLPADGGRRPTVLSDTGRAS